MRIAIAALASLAAIASSAATCGRSRVVLCGGGRGGGCVTTTFSNHQRARDLPPDILNLPENSLARQKYAKIFDLIPKTIRNWQDKDYKERRRFLDSSAWTEMRNGFAAKLKTMRVKLDRNPAVSEAEVMKLADEMVVYGRGLVKGSFPQMPTFMELAEMYGFTEVAKFLKKALDVDRYRHTGMAQEYLDTPEFNDFDKLAVMVSPDDWREFRTRWRQLNELYKNNPKRQQPKGKQKKK